MMPKLPDPVANYLAAEKAKDADKLALCFADDALVHDEGRDYRDRDAIRTVHQKIGYPRRKNRRLAQAFIIVRLKGNGFFLNVRE